MRKPLLRIVSVLLLVAAAATAVVVVSSRARRHNEPVPREPRPTVTRASWNRDVNRLALVTTIPYIVGNQIASCGGATEVGGGFINHLHGTEGASEGQPIPAEIDPSIAFVELDNIRLEATNRQAWATGSDGDATTNGTDPNRHDISNLYLKGIHLELSRQWGTIELPNGKIRGPFLHPYPEQTVWPRPRALVDVQGFVRWDASHTEEDGHYCSGWEIHPVSAWRLHRSPGDTRRR
ncbi:MAG TPA: hypothetical protein VKB10_09410 [Gaiellaceae bacterium]|nr:hypothetical protein [Gaiellaceae bacterium]